jgi:hypothetical protein
MSIRRIPKVMEGLGCMAIRESRQRIVRTNDDIQYEVESEDTYKIRGPVGELLHTDQSLQSYVNKVARTVWRAVEDTGANKLTAQFGVSVTAEGAFYLTQGQSGAHMLVTMEFESSNHRDLFE